MPTQPADVADSLLAAIKYLADETATIKPMGSPDSIRAAADAAQALSEAFKNLGLVLNPDH
jgi:hypothetical protein